MSANPWASSSGVAAQIQPMSPIIGSGFEFGVLTNVGANCLYIENPLYVPINVQPGPEFGLTTPPPMGTVQPGVTIPPFSWATVPMNPDSNVLYDARAWEGFTTQRGGFPIGGGARGMFYLPTAEVNAYPAGRFPPPRPARYWFFDTPSPQFNKGSLFRVAPLSYTFAAGVAAITMDRNWVYYCSPAGSQTTLSNVLNSAGQPNVAQFVVNGWVDRCVIIGVMFNINTNNAPGAVKWLGELGVIYFMDEFSVGASLYPDVIWDPSGIAGGIFAPATLNTPQVPQGVNSTMGDRPASLFFPVPGARAVMLKNSGTTGTPVAMTDDISMTLLLSEY